MLPIISDPILLLLLFFNCRIKWWNGLKWSELHILKLWNWNLNVTILNIKHSHKFAFFFNAHIFNPEIKVTLMWYAVTGQELVVCMNELENTTDLHLLCCWSVASYGWKIGLVGTLGLEGDPCPTLCEFDGTLSVSENADEQLQILNQWQKPIC